MMLLSRQYINQNAPTDFHLDQDSYPISFMIHLCHMNSTVFDKTDIVKKLIVPLTDLMQLSEVSGPQARQTLHLLHHQVKK